MGRVFLRDARRRRRRRPGRRHAPADAGGRPGLRRRRRAAMGREPERAVDFFDVKGDVEALLAPAQGRVRAGRASGAAPGALRAHRDRWPACVGVRRRAASALAPGATSCRTPRCCSSWTSRRCVERRCPACRARAAAAGRASATWRSSCAKTVTPRRGHRRHCTTSRPGSCSRATLFDIYKPPRASGRDRRRASTAWRCARTAGRRTPH